MLPRVAPLNVSSGCIPFNFFIMPAAASTIHSTSCFLPYFRLTTVVQVLLFATPEGEIYWLMSGDRTGHSAVLPFLTIFPDVSS